MAHQTLYVVRDVRHPLYKTRMLTAGQALELSGPDTRTYRKLGVELTDQAPRKARVAVEPAVEVEQPEPAAEPVADEPAPKKKAVRRKKPE